MSKFPGEAITYKSLDSIVNDNNNIYPAEFLNSLCPGGMSPHEFYYAICLHQVVSVMEHALSVSNSILIQLTA